MICKAGKIFYYESDCLSDVMIFPYIAHNIDDLNELDYFFS